MDCTNDRGNPSLPVFINAIVEAYQQSQVGKKLVKGVKHDRSPNLSIRHATPAEELPILSKKRTPSKELPFGLEKVRMKEPSKRKRPLEIAADSSEVEHGGASFLISKAIHTIAGQASRTSSKKVKQECLEFGVSAVNRATPKKVRPKVLNSISSDSSRVEMDCFIDFIGEVYYQRKQIERKLKIDVRKHQNLFLRHASPEELPILTSMGVQSCYSGGKQVVTLVRVNEVDDLLTQKGLCVPLKKLFFMRTGSKTVTHPLSGSNLPLNETVGLNPRPLSTVPSLNETVGSSVSVVNRATPQKTRPKLLNYDEDVEILPKNVLSDEFVTSYPTKKVIRSIGEHKRQPAKAETFKIGVEQEHRHFDRPGHVMKKMNDLLAGCTKSASSSDTDALRKLAEKLANSSCNNKASLGKRILPPPPPPSLKKKIRPADTRNVDSPALKTVLNYTNHPNTNGGIIVERANRSERNDKDISNKDLAWDITKIPSIMAKNHVIKSNKRQLPSTLVDSRMFFKGFTVVPFTTKEDFKAFDDQFTNRERKEKFVDYIKENLRRNVKDKIKSTILEFCQIIFGDHMFVYYQWGKKTDNEGNKDSFQGTCMYHCLLEAVGEVFFSHEINIEEKVKKSKQEIYAWFKAANDTQKRWKKE